MNRRNFLKVAGLVPFFGASGAAGIRALPPNSADDGKAWCGKKHPLAGRKLPPWKPGVAKLV